MRKNVILVAVCGLLALTVHLTYLGYVRPQAQHLLDTAKANQQAPQASIVVTLKDPEQEICIIMALCCLILMAEKFYRIYAQHYLFQVDLLGTGGPPSLASLDSLSPEIRSAPLVHTLMASIRRFEATGDVHNAAEVIDSNVLTTSMKLEADNNYVHYLIWAIPSIGFIGTVRGISAAMGEAYRALEGDIASMTEALGVAFNSTLVALLLSVVLTLVLHALQKQQDHLVLDIEDYCDRNLVKRLAGPVAREESVATG